VRRGSALLAVAVLLSGSPAAARVQNPSLLREGGLGASAALISLVYSPFKLVYAMSGLVIGGGSLLWTWGDRDAAMAVVHSAVGGDYVITPEHLGGSAPLHFTGQ
jgi:hypothetical protein